MSPGQPLFETSAKSTPLASHSAGRSGLQATAQELTGKLTGYWQRTRGTLGDLLGISFLEKIESHDVGRSSLSSSLLLIGKFHGTGACGGSAPKGEAWPQNVVHPHRASAPKFQRIQRHENCPKKAH